MKKFLATTTVIALVLSVVACSATPVRRSLKESWHDTLTAEKIRYKLMKDKDVKKSRMHVEVFRGQVTLTGRSVTDAEKARAETLAKSVKRVTGVENYIHVVGDGKAASPAVVAVGPVPKAASAIPGAVIEEKTMVVEKANVSKKISEDDLPATVPTIREGTGTGRPVATVGATTRKAVESKTTATKTAVKTPRSAAKDTQLAVVKKAAVTTRPVTAVSAPIAPKEALPMSSVPAAKVVGKSKTGLPWDGEVYEDDASSVKSVATASRQPTPATAAPVKTAAPPAAAPTPAPTTDDLAIEATQELEKLRSRH